MSLTDEDKQWITEQLAAQVERFKAGLYDDWFIKFEKTATGYSAHVPGLPGCVAAGSTMEETDKLMRKAIEMHLAGMREDEK